MKKLLIAVTVLCILIAGCTPKPDDDVDSDSYNPSPCVLGDFVFDDDTKQRLLSPHTHEDNDEVLEMFIYLLGYGSELTGEEIAQIGAGSGRYESNVLYLYEWYMEKALDTVTMQVLEYSAILDNPRTIYEFALRGRWQGRDYTLKVDVTDNGGLDIPLGQQEWVLQTGDIPRSNFYDIPVPLHLITLEEYNLRREARKFEEQVALIACLRHYFAIPFDSYSDVSNNALMQYVVHRAAAECDYEKTGFTPAEFDAKTLEYLGIDHLELDGGGVGYSPENRVSYEMREGCYSEINDYFWRAIEDENGVHIDYIHPKIEDWPTAPKPLRYTVKDGRIISAVDISDEVEGMSFGSIGR